MSLRCRLLGITKISNKRIEKRISSGKISDEKLTKLCQFYANPNVPLALITGGIFYKKVLKLQKSSYHLYRLEAKKRNSFFKFTVNVNFRKDIFDFDNCKIKEPENAGTLESIYWSKRNGRKIEGKIKYFITRIPLNDPDGIIYKRKAFAGEAKWQVDLIMKYEERFAQIRKATRILGEFKRKARQLNIYLGDINKTLNDMESTELNSTITNEENGYNEVNDLTEDK